MANTKHTTLDQLKMLATRTKTELDILDKKIDDIAVPEYEIKKQETAESGYIATYQLFKNDEAVGVKINIPKDYLVKSAEIKTVTEEDQPYEGAKVGDKYVDFVINTKDADDTASHLYLPVNELVDTYTAGDGIEITDANVVKVKIDADNANGLGVGTNGLKLAMATAPDPTNSIEGNAGAMSAADKAKLDSFEQASDTEVSAMLIEVFGEEQTQTGGSSDPGTGT